VSPAPLVHVTTVTPSRAAALQATLESRGFSFKPVAHARFSAQAEDVTVTCYLSGKLVVQGAGTDLFVRGVLGEAPTSVSDQVVISEPMIGTDESGKGDYFGPLVVAACYATPEHQDLLRQLGVRDSKQCSDLAILRVEMPLKKALPHATWALMPADYNARYRETKNLNAILGAGHAECIERVLEQTDCRRALSDKFGDERYIRAALGVRGKTVDLVQRPHAESHPAVAAASFLARAEFLHRLKELEEITIGELPRGASDRVEAAALEILRLQGEATLARVAKLHFKTTDRVRARWAKPDEP
jgi:ribonuclease HIII